MSPFHKPLFWLVEVLQTPPLSASARIEAGYLEVAMDPKKKKTLEAAGWRSGDAADFLGLSDAEAALIDIRVRLAKALQDRREKAGLTQKQLAEKLKTSQPRVATMLAARDVSIDQLVKSLLVLGADVSEVAEVVGGG